MTVIRIDTPRALITPSPIKKKNVTKFPRRRPLEQTQTQPQQTCPQPMDCWEPPLYSSHQHGHHNWSTTLHTSPCYTHSSYHFRRSMPEYNYEPPVSLAGRPWHQTWLKTPRQTKNRIVEEEEEPKTRKVSCVQFCPAVTVLEIPNRNEYSDRTKHQLFHSRKSLRSMIRKNAIEYLWEGPEWRKAVEEDGFVPISPNRSEDEEDEYVRMSQPHYEYVHPAHIPEFRRLGANAQKMRRVVRSSKAA